jgi:hypothetical protein
MTASAPRAIAKLDIRYPWLFGASFDMAFFFLPLFFAIWCYWMTQSAGFAQQAVFSILVLSAFGAGPIHQGATFFFYFDKRNRDYYASDANKQRIFYWAPPLIILASIAVYMLVPGGKAAVNLIWMLWALQHFIQQNVGILLLYHNHNKGEAIVPRPLEQNSLWAASTFFFVLFIQRVMIGTANILTESALVLSLLWALWACGRYVFELVKQVRSGAYLNVPALGFWLLSVWSFLPLGVLGSNFGEAYLITTTVHWFQYIGLNYILVRNKYKTDDHLMNLPARHPYLLLVGVCLLFFAANFGLSVAAKDIQISAQLREVAWATGVGIALCHFFLDAFIWRFREPYQRQAVLPYLKQR